MIDIYFWADSDTQCRHCVCTGTMTSLNGRMMIQVSAERKVTLRREKGSGSICSLVMNTRLQPGTKPHSGRSAPIHRGKQSHFHFPRYNKLTQLCTRATQLRGRPAIAFKGLQMHSRILLVCHRGRRFRAPVISQYFRTRFDS